MGRCSKRGRSFLCFCSRYASSFGLELAESIPSSVIVNSIVTSVDEDGRTANSIVAVLAV